MLWIPIYYVVLFWFMFASIMYLLYIYIVYISLNDRLSIYCNCGRQRRLIKGSLHYFAYSSLGGPLWLFIISVVIFFIRFANAIFIGYFLQIDTHVYDSDHVTTFVLHGCAEVVFVFFFLVLYATSIDCWRYIFLSIFHLGQMAIYIAIMAILTATHQYTFYCALVNIVWLTVFTIVVLCREVLHYKYRDKHYRVQNMQIPSISIQTPSAYAVPTTSGKQRMPRKPSGGVVTQTGNLVGGAIKSVGRRIMNVFVPILGDRRLHNDGEVPVVPAVLTDIPIV